MTMASVQIGEAVGAVERLSATGAQDAILPHIQDYSNCASAGLVVG
jgi:hypothetical protein